MHANFYQGLQERFQLGLAEEYKVTSFYVSKKFRQKLHKLVLSV